MADLKPYKPSARERIANALMGVAGRLGAGRYAQQDVGKFVRGALDFIPGVGDAVAADEARHSWQQGDKLGAGINAVAAALGVVPVVGDAAARGVRAGAKNIRKPLETFADTNANLYNPPMKPQRPFAADYPDGVQADALGRPLNDIAGRPLGARFVVGRTRVGGGDTGVPTELYDEVAKALTGHPAAAVPASALPRRAVGVYRRDHRRQATGVIDYYQGLRPDQVEKVVPHEIGHAIDDIAGEMPVAGLDKELRQVYHDLNEPSEFRRGRVLPKRQQTGPEVFDYSKDEAKRELIAEAIRAYMVNPNYIKTMAPKTAARIRDYVNSNPALKSIIQFNSIAALLAAPAAVGTLAGQPRAPAPPTSERNVL